MPLKRLPKIFGFEKDAMKGDFVHPISSLRRFISINK